MTIKVKLPNGTVVECDTPEEAARFVRQTDKDMPVCGKDGCTEPPSSSHCGSCGTHHEGMC